MFMQEHIHYSKTFADYHTLGIYKNKVICNCLPHHKIFPWQCVIRLKFWDLRKYWRQKKTTNIYNTDSVKQVNCWKTQTLPYYHTNTLSFCFIFTLCAVSSFTLIKYLIEYPRVRCCSFLSSFICQQPTPHSLCFYFFLYSLHFPLSQVVQHWPWACLNTQGALRIEDANVGDEDPGTGTAWGIKNTHDLEI